MNYSVTKNGLPLSKDLYTFDEKTLTFSSNEDWLVLDFSGFNGCTFNTGSGCTFSTGYECTFNTGYECTFSTGSGCTFKTGSGCIFNTGDECTFNTGYECTFSTGSGCTFKTGDECTFKTGDECTLLYWGKEWHRAFLDEGCWKTEENKVVPITGIELLKFKKKLKRWGK